jgi:hypothetical protein
MQSIFGFAQGAEKPERALQCFRFKTRSINAKLLIRTTADYQRFSGKLPTVGGDTDIALVTHYRGFRWINQKLLYQILEREDGKS